MQTDLIIAGGGAAGILTATRLREKTPEKKMVLLERESSLGGRLKSASPDQDDSWSYGLHQVNRKLYDFWDQTLKLDPESDDLPSLNPKRIQSAGILAAGRIESIDVQSLFSKVGARAVAGAAAARDWSNVEKAFESVESGKRKDQQFANVWSGTRKSPGAIALDYMSRYMGIADMWSAATSAVSTRAKALSEDELYGGDWSQALSVLVKRLEEDPNVEIVTESSIIDSSYEQSKWSIVTNKGIYEAPATVIAQSPWEALEWLPKKYWPEALLSLAVKSKPTSTVVLTEKVNYHEAELPDVVFVPAEGVQIHILPRFEICYQATLDYELSMQAPDVVKAVKRLKRARRKLHVSIPALETKSDHVGLLPVGWGQPVSFQDRRFAKKIDLSLINQSHLSFCGDSYGPEYNGDENFVNSIISTCDKVSQSEGAPVHS